MFELGSYVACIAEGGAETAILELLLDHHLLIFERDTLIDEKILSCRSASTFESRYLRIHSTHKGCASRYRLRALCHALP